MKARLAKIAIVHKIEKSTLQLRDELEKSVQDKLLWFPSFTAIKMQGGHLGDDFIKNNYTILIYFKQQNLN